MVKMDTISKIQNPNRKIRKVTWEEFDRLLDRLEYLINISNEKFDGITGIERGGLIVAICLSHRLNLPFVYGKRVEPYQYILITDDISDSGNTLQETENLIYNFKTAVLHLRHTSKFIPDFYVEKIQEEWVHYPYEDG